jgi:hypothetical protein
MSDPIATYVTIPPLRPLNGDGDEIHLWDEVGHYRDRSMQTFCGRDCSQGEFGDETVSGVASTCETCVAIFEADRSITKLSVTLAENAWRLVDAVLLRELGRVDGELAAGRLTASEHASAMRATQGARDAIGRVLP